MSVMPVFGAERHAFLHMENAKNGKTVLTILRGG